MAASDHLSPNQFPGYQPAVKQGEQLPMFMTPHEIGGMLSPDYLSQVKDVPETMRSQYTHMAETDALHGNIRGTSPLDRVHREVKEQGGINKPVKVMHLPSGVAALYDGHHRSVVALESNRLVPVEHFFDHKTAMDASLRDNEKSKRWR